MGVDEDPWFDVGDPTEIDATHSTITGHSQMVIDDFNCDGYLDVAMPADDGGIVRYGDSMSLLGGGSYHIEMNTKSSYELAVSDLDEDNKPDLVASSTDDGEIFLLLGQCGTDPYPSYGVYDFDPGGIPSPNPHLAIVNMCGTTGDNPGIAIAYERVVHVICSDGSGSLANVIEPHGEEDPGGLGLDYFWNTQPLPGSGSIGAITSFGDHPELITLSGHAIVRLNRSSCGYFTGWSQALSQPLHGGTQPLNRIELVPSSNSANWRRIAVTGNLGLMILQ